MKFPLLALALLWFAFARAQAPSAPRTFLLSPSVLAAQKAHPSPDLLKLIEADADSALKLPPQTVTAKDALPPSGDKHDYLSMARYYWPNPETPNHLPYVRHDGLSNPEINSIADHEELTRTDEKSLSLALGWYFTGDERYAKHAAELLRAFFLDPATRMNPNLQYAQYIAGVNTGRGAGVLDARSLAMTVDAIGLLAGSKSWTAEDQDGMVKWFTDYYAWLTTSKNGLDEQKAPNNHGSWYAVQQTSIAMFLGRPDEARKIAERVRDLRIPSQFDSQGMQKYELARTNSFSYSAFNLQALTEVAAVVSSTGIDLYKPAPGAVGILGGIDALMPYDASHPWPHQQISGQNRDSICFALIGAAAHKHEPKYVSAQQRFNCKPTPLMLLMGLRSPALH